MDTFPWEPPDGESGGSGGRSDDGGVGSLVWWGYEFGVSCKQVGGHGWEVADREVDAHEAVSCLEMEVAGAEEVQLDLGLSDITKYSSYSKLWRTLYFINDAPFCIHKHGFNAAGEWVDSSASPSNGNWSPVQRCSVRTESSKPSKPTPS